VEPREKDSCPSGREFLFIHQEVSMSEQKQDKYEESDLFRIRHSAAHVMAQAVLEMFPNGKYGIGPPIDDGFYYDFDLPRTLTPEDLEVLEKRMRQIVSGAHEFRKKVVSAAEARSIFSDQPYKLELIEELERGGIDEHGQPLEEKPEISIYTHDDFVDLCRGPHVGSTQQINPEAIKLLNVAGAYWRGDEGRAMRTDEHAGDQKAHEGRQPHLVEEEGDGERNGEQDDELAQYGDFLFGHGCEL